MHNHLFTKLRNRWNSFIVEKGNENFDVNFQTQFPFLSYFEKNDVAFAILNNHTFETEYHSQNYFDVLGLDKEAFDKRGTTTFIEAIDKSQENFFTLLPNFFEQYWHNTPDESKKKLNRTTVGLFFHHKDKGIIRLLVQTNILEVNAALAPTYLFVLYHDITYMMKDNFYWFRIEDSDKKGKTFTYHDGLKEVLKGDIISSREKEILLLISEGKSTDEIAQTLFISKITVNNHRQNMLNRVGVKDTTGLITIAKLCKLI
jgi:DNA-binding CsgD family transcriptional regulator